MLIRLPGGEYVNPEHVVSVCFECCKEIDNNFDYKIKVNMSDGTFVIAEILKDQKSKVFLLNAITKISNVINGIEYLK